MLKLWHFKYSPSHVEALLGRYFAPGVDGGVGSGYKRYVARSRAGNLNREKSAQLDLKKYVEPLCV